jgi:hypothetical protein
VSVDPIRVGGETLNLANRFVFTSAIVGSPALAAETIIAQLQITENEQVVSGVWLDGWAAFTVGTSGSAVQLRIRRTNVAGQIVANSGALTGGVAAAALLAQDCGGVDTGLASIGGQIYVLTLQVTAGAAVSTVTAVVFKAQVI